MTYTFDAGLRLWDARRTDSWVFVDLPTDVADEILDTAGGRARGFGSLRVEVRIGSTVWRTSICPGANTYALPLKKAVRRAEGLDPGDLATIHLTVLDG